MFRNAARISRPVVRNAAVSSRAFSSTRIAASQVTSLHTFTEEEEMLRESVRRFATDVVAPKVREMDENEMMDPAIIKGLFEQGVCPHPQCEAHRLIFRFPAYGYRDKCRLGWGRIFIHFSYYCHRRAGESGPICIRTVRRA